MSRYVVCSEIYSSKNDQTLDFLEQTYQDIISWVEKNPSKTSPTISELPNVHFQSLDANRHPSFSYATNIMNSLLRNHGYGTIDQWISRKSTIQELMTVLIDIQAQGATPDLRGRLETVLGNKEAHSMCNSLPFVDPCIYVDQINFYKNDALDSMVFLPLGWSNSTWSILGALMLKKNRFHQAASSLSYEGKQNIRVLRRWAQSKGMKQISANPEVWGANTGKWLLKIKPEVSSRGGSLASGSRIPRFDSRLKASRGGFVYINPFTGQVGKTKKNGCHLPLEKKYY